MRKNAQLTSDSGVKSKETHPLQIELKFRHSIFSVFTAIIMLVFAVVLQSVSTGSSIWDFVLKVVAEILNTVALGVLITSLLSVTDIFDIFSSTINDTKDAIMSEVTELKESIDFVTDIDKFPFNKLSDEQLMRISQKTMECSLARRNNGEIDSNRRDKLIKELSGYYNSILDSINNGVIYNFYSRTILIEPDSKQGRINVAMTMNQSLEIPQNANNISFFHSPVFETENEANHLLYSLIQIDGKNQLLDDEFAENLSKVTMRGTKYQRSWQKLLSPGSVHNLFMQYKFIIESGVYVHSAVLTYPAEKYDITIKIIGDEAEEWKIDIDVFTPKGHRLDASHKNDAYVLPLTKGQRGCRILKRESNECLLDGTAYKIVVFRNPRNTI